MKNLIMILIIAGIIYFMYMRWLTPNREEMLTYLSTVPGTEAKDIAIFNSMNDQELRDSYTLVQLSRKGITVDKIDPSLQMRLSVISKKYNIFT